MERKEPSLPQKPYSIRLIELRYKRSFEVLVSDRRARGRSWRQIGREFGVSHTLVYRHGREPQGEPAPALSY